MRHQKKTFGELLQRLKGQRQDSSPCFAQTTRGTHTGARGVPPELLPLPPPRVPVWDPGRSLTSPRLRVASHTKERFITTFEKRRKEKKGIERRINEQKGEQRSTNENKGVPGKGNTKHPPPSNPRRSYRATAAFWDSVLIYSYSRSGTRHYLRVLVPNGISELSTCSYCQVLLCFENLNPQFLKWRRVLYIEVPIQVKLHLKKKLPPLYICMYV